ncbi:hypothetical protein QUB68_20070 [Microcoleus sp. A006_D1]|uniref:hypothetical protein n=1 Tax=Microcoleus sp. A006_D1 TaxID=3055267 RepID=UPI002FD31062
MNAVYNSRLICLQEGIFLLDSGELGDQSKTLNRKSCGIFPGFSEAFKSLSIVLQH